MDNKGARRSRIPRDVIQRYAEELTGEILLTAASHIRTIYDMPDSQMIALQKDIEKIIIRETLYSG